MTVLRPDTHLFTFAIVGDTHVKPTSGDQSAPWKVNDKATARARFVAREMARYEPKFIIHLGDLVHPVPELATFQEAVALTKEVFRQHHNQMHVLPGNHDIGDKPNRMMPAKSVRASWIEIHESHYGPSWRSFDDGGVRFVLLNNPVLNSGLPQEQAQYAWLERTLAEAEGQRIFVLMHYPLFLLSPDEPGTYDNIDEPARSRLLALLERHKVEAVFAGHVHNIFYHRSAETEFYVMMATSFVRQDYAEMFPIEAVHENGRDDAEKLGFAIVDVHSDGHVVHYIRSHGAELEEGGEAQAPAKRTTALLAHPKKPGGAPFGVFLRHAWAQTVALPQNGPMDEFLRKEARNDYQVAALWRLGLRHLRVPVSDVLAAASRARMRDLAANGHAFTVSGFGIPAGQQLETIRAAADTIARYELVLPFDEIAARRDDIAAFRAALGRPLVVAPVATSADEAKVGSKIELFVSHGFTPARLGDIEALIAAGVAADGYVVRVGMGEDLPAIARTLRDWSRGHGCVLDLHLRIAANNPAANVRDDEAILRAIVELYAAALAYPEVPMLADPFMDVDRGYFVRHGLIDRRCNLRRAGMAVEAMTAYLGTAAAARAPMTLEARRSAHATELCLVGAGLRAHIVLPLCETAVPVVSAMKDGFGQPPLAVPLDRPWAVAPDLGSALEAADGRWPEAVSRPTMLIARA
ncbi:MAG: metallophosphoesterase [Hyphomicrobiaceae bacterium]|nr:metallophosphoesterase [Hyphomicrobiaceae bacterium]